MGSVLTAAGAPVPVGWVVAGAGLGAQAANRAAEIKRKVKRRVNMWGLLVLTRYPPTLTGRKKFRQEIVNAIGDTGNGMQTASPNAKTDAPW
jgi:hypothetical protein